MRKELFFIILTELFLVTNSSKANAQAFEDVTWMLGDSISCISSGDGYGLSFYDINYDGWDDITFGGSGDSLICLINNQGVFERVNLVPINGTVFVPLWGDFDNDGDADLFLSNNSQPIKLFRNEGNLLMVDVTDEMGLNMPARLSSGASWGDINNDGYLDLFVANLDAGIGIGSWLFLNNQGQSFTNVSSTWGVNVNNDLSFQGTFFDYDGDGKQDLHVANDRQPIDALLQNQESYFVNNANYAGLSVMCDAMSSSIADYNHDGDLDIYVTNRPYGNFLWDNQGDGTFINAAAETGSAVYKYCWGANWIDYNNDTWEDLFINHTSFESDEISFLYNSSGSFEELTGVVQGVEPNFLSRASAIGDFNNDGFSDIAVSGLSNRKCRLFQSYGEGGNFVKVKLEGTISNRDGIGSLINYFIDGQKYTRYTFSGTDYLAQNSQWLILGTDVHEIIDSIHVTWLSGWTDRLYNVATGGAMIIKEGQVNLNIQSVNENQGQVYLCPGNSAELISNLDEPVIWNTGEISNQIQVNESGAYYAFYISELGVESYSDTIWVVVHNMITPEIEFSNPTCYGAIDGWILVADAGSNSTILLEDQNTSSSFFENLTSNTYSIDYIDENNCSQNFEIVIEDPTPINAELSITPVNCFNENSGMVILDNLSGGTGNLTYALYDAIGNEIPESQWNHLHADGYLLFVYDENGCEQNIPLNIDEPEMLQLNIAENISEDAVWVEAEGGTPPYEITLNGGLINNGSFCQLAFGQNEFILTDFNGCNEVQIIQNIPTSIEENLPSPLWYFTSPNNIVFNASLISNVQIFDLTGRLVYYGKDSFESHATGTYLLKIWDTSGTVQVKKLTL